MAATTAVVAGTATAVSGGVRRHQMANEQQQTGAAPEAAPPVEEPAEDPYERLEKLGKLHEQGILTDEEFAAEKAKLLG